MAPLPNESIMNSLMKHFKDYSHQSIGQHFFDLAYIIDDKLPEGPEKTVALRKLLESKDCAERSLDE